MDKFALAPAFLQTSEPLVSLKLSEARLQADSRFPWIVLIPRRSGAREMEHISNGDRAQLMDEIIAASAAVRAIGAAIGRPVERVNVGQIGLKTPQLHIHVVGRRADDECWPEPVWGRGEGKDYDARTLEVAIAAALGVLKSMQAAA